MPKKKLERVILIVCEGTATEPQYFKWIAENRSCTDGAWDMVDIHHSSTIPNDIPIPVKSELGGNRKTRKFENPNRRKQNKRNILKELFEDQYGSSTGIEKYEEIKAVPLRYVAHARLLEERSNIYEEIWVVFDKNGHSYHKEAFELAERKVNDKKINIAFSSRSFEQWILLHFEKSSKPFEKTSCKDNNGKLLGCNADKGCHGELCLTGYISSKYLPKYEKSNKNADLDDMMNILLSKTIQAFENAKWLRQEQQEALQENSGQVYMVNPYTNMDILVKNLLDIN
ncbi:MAG: hypothetical protein RIR11_3502 [Bacteroidota bacterium]|jgi:hypothetical protein